MWSELDEILLEKEVEQINRKRYRRLIARIYNILDSDMSEEEKIETIRNILCNR